LVIKDLLLFFIYDDDHGWKIMFLKMYNTTQREWGQPQLFSVHFVGHRMLPLVCIVERLQCLWKTMLLIC